MMLMRDLERPSRARVSSRRLRLHTMKVRWNLEGYVDATFKASSEVACDEISLAGDCGIGDQEGRRGDLASLTTNNCDPCSI